MEVVIAIRVDGGAQLELPLPRLFGEGARPRLELGISSNKDGGGTHLDGVVVSRYSLSILVNRDRDDFVPPGVRVFSQKELRRRELSVVVK